MITDEFIPGQSAMRIVGGKYEYTADSKSRIMLPIGGFTPREEMLYRLAGDISRRCAKDEARRNLTSPSGMQLLCRIVLESEKEEAVIFVGINDNFEADVKMLFSGKTPSKSRLLNAVQDLINTGRYTRCTLAHSFSETSGISDSIYANELYQIAAKAGLKFEDYLVFRGTDCYSIRQRYRDFWK